MNKLFLVVCLFLFGTFAQAQSFFSEYKTKVLEANEKQIIIADSSEFVVGASGIVSHKFDARSTSIIARVDVISKDGTKAVLRIEKFEMLSQGAFPDTGVKPAIGDEVTINYLYDRALIITPNQNVYTEVTKKFNTITWVHPDIVAAYLTKLYRPNPDKKIFQQACYQNAASIIFFGINNTGYFVDCHNFNTLQTVSISNNGEIQLPFYARIKNIDTSWFSWDSSKIGDYNTYYTTLISKK
ncbi:plasminogen-binding N-terminal domain-containing protein [Sulfurospirillum oryzae]|uniref:plasminogen-binding N-terminal domain-containing protein n=1 Tax=Sulfurospirillum oryzae TaxID=2976535 RepID=UPI0021E79099|nr:plasminogen-binding N-terminal domain-containing protein [Sulfurospirillum oryzae]